METARTYAQIQSEGLQSVLDETTKLVKEGRVSDVEASRAANTAILGNIAVQLAGIRDELAAIREAFTPVYTVELGEDVNSKVQELLNRVADGVEAIPDDPLGPEVDAFSEALEDAHPTPETPDQNEESEKQDNA